MAALPTGLKKLLAGDAKSKARWDNLTPIAQRDFISWLTSAKQEATREKRLKRVPSMLASGKKRPCCFAVVPMDLYGALGKNEKAKATWKSLTPDHKRDFSDWVEAAKDVATRKVRTEKAIKLLAAGKRRPG